MIVTARDVYGELLPWPYEVWVKRLGRSGSGKVARDVPPDGRAEFDLAWPADYRVRIVCEGHAEVAVNADGSTAVVEVAVPVDPSAVVGFTWPDPLPEIPGMVWSEAGGLDNRRRGTVLNIWAKLWATSLGVTPAATYVEEVLEVREDRIICRVSPAIRDAMTEATEAGSVEFVTSAVGHEPPEGYGPGPSIKTPPPGGLQVTLFKPDAAGLPLLADIDIDEEDGFYHALRAAGHHLTGSKTDAVEIQQILVAQGVDPGWRPLIA